MIVQEFSDSFLLVRQPDHGLQTGAFAHHWGNEETPGFAFRDNLIEAAARHDNGWIGWESRPAPDAETGEPLQFFRIGRHDHVAAYRRGIKEAVESDPWVGLIVSMHGVGLYNNRYDTWTSMREQQLSEEERALVDEFIAEQTDLQNSLARATLGSQYQEPPTANPEIWYQYLLLQVWDRLSLQYVWRLAADGEISPLPRPGGGVEVLRCHGRGEFTLALDPYPFDRSPCEFPINCRLLPMRRYENPEDLLGEYLAAPIRILECRAVAP